MPGRNCYTAGRNRSLEHKGFSIFKIGKAKTGIPGHIKWKEHMNI